MRNYSPPFVNIALSLLFFALLSLISCDWSKSTKKPDVSSIDVELNWVDLYQDIAQIDTATISAQSAAIAAKHPAFFPFYVDQVMQFGPYAANDTAPYLRNFKAYLANPYVKEVYDTIALVYKDMSREKQQLTKAFQYFKYYFPNKALPSIVTTASNFSYASYSYDTISLAISLDMYLGSEYKFYTALYPNYLTQKFHRAYIVPDAVQVLGNMYFTYLPKENTLLANMIEEGKRLYFQDLLLPDAKDHNKIGYQVGQINWCKENEAEVWNFFVDNDLLYSTNKSDMRNVLEPGPTTTGMPMQAPGRVGAWVGWQIVRGFMQNNPKITYEQLLNQYDAQSILSKSKYKPKP